VRHRVSLDAKTRNTELLTFDQDGACSAEGIKHTMLRTYAEPLQILPHQVRREGQHEPILRVDRSIFRVELVFSPLAARLRAVA
jgi:hypothetical protein